ncbi:MAG: TolC family protein [Chitinispirillaceae bacterium]|nr:TolC family protein [Chitinispirillaceae bacterium]
MNPRWVLLFGLLFSTDPIAGDGREEQDTLLTLQGAVEHAINHGLSMRVATTQRQSVAIDLFAAWEALMPTARATLSTSGGQSLTSSSSSFSAGASAGTDYELSPSRFLSYRAGRNRSSAAQYDVDQRRKDIAAEVVLYYVKTVGAKKLIEVEEHNVEYQQRKLEEIEALFQQGIKARSDVLQQKTGVFEAQSRLLGAVQEFHRVKFTVLDILGLPLSDRYRFDTTAVMALLFHFSGDSAAQPSSTLSPETDAITAQRYRVVAAEAALTGSRYGYIPSLSFSAGWSAAAEGGSMGGSVARLGEGGGSSSLHVGASLGIPLFDKKQRWLQVKNAEINLQSAQLELERLERAFMLAVRRAELDDAMAIEQISVADVRCAAAQEALQAMEERYSVGASTIVELNAVQSDYTEAQSALVQARFDRISSRIELLHETGRIDHVIALITMRPSEKR